MKFRGLIVIILALSIPAGIFLSPRSQTSAPDLPAIDKYVQAQMKAACVPGIALGIVHNGEIVHTAGFGRANSAGTPVTSETPFVIGSVSKGFTALAIMQLVEEGEIDLDASVQRYLPWFTLADQQAAAQITIRTLLNQTSGLGYNDGIRPLWDQPGGYTLEARIRQMAILKLQRAPGLEFEYSNYNYMLLGMIVEAVSGQPYSSYISEHIFLPLGMQNSVASSTEGKFNDLVDAHRWWFGFSIPVEAAYPDDAVPAGFIIASADDMSKYLAFQQTGNAYILSSDGLNDLHSSCVPSGGGNEYCFGWVRGQFGGLDALNHEGAAQGYYSVIASDPVSGWGVVVLSTANNMLVAPANEIAASILGYLVKGSPLVVSHQFWQIYAVVDITILLLTGLMIWSITRLPRWGKKLAVSQPRGFSGWSLKLVLPVLAEFIVPYIVWIFLPQGAGFPMWKVMGIFQPDLTAWVFLMTGLFMLRGGLRGLLAVVNLGKKG